MPHPIPSHHTALLVTAHLITTSDDMVWHGIASLHLVILPVTSPARRIDHIITPKQIMYTTPQHNNSSHITATSHRITPHRITPHHSTPQCHHLTSHLHHITSQSTWTYLWVGFSVSSWVALLPVPRASFVGSPNPSNLFLNLLKFETVWVSQSFKES